MTDSRDIVERLETWAIVLHDKEIRGPQPDIASDIYEAISLIKLLRKAAGAVTDGPGFVNIAKDLPRRSTEPPDPK